MTKEKPQVVTTRTDGPLHYLTITAPEHRPSWKVYGAGWAELSAQVHERAEYVSLNITEFAQAADTTKRGVTRASYLTLDGNAGRALYDFLGQLYGPKAPAAQAPAAPAPQLTPGELAYIGDALDSHKYWQIAEQRQRNDGYVTYDETDDNAPELRYCDEIITKVEGLAKEGR